MKKKIQNPIDIFRSNGGRLRMSEAIKHGMTRYTLYSLRDRKVIELVSRGIYQLVDLPSISDPDLVTVSLRFPKAVVCLVSALAFHDLTTQIPHQVTIAVPKDSRIQKLDYPPIKAHKFSKREYESGVGVHRIDDVTINIYSPEKTIADCFKFRNQLGMDIVIEALKILSFTKENRFVCAQEVREDLQS